MIFINYRRDDAGAEAHRIADRLKVEYGDHNVFVDARDIEIGKRFESVILGQIAKRRMMLAIMGPQWLKMLQDRIGDQDDYVRLEIKAAIDGNKIIVPVVVGRNASMDEIARPDQLPTDIKNCVAENGVPIRTYQSFDADMAVLCREINRRLGISPARRRWFFGLGTAVLGTLGFSYRKWSDSSSAGHASSVADVKFEGHNAVRHEATTYTLGSRVDPTEREAFVDGEGVVFRRRHLSVVRRNSNTGELAFHYLTLARPAHTAMRVIDGNLLIFINQKFVANAFAMTGTLFLLENGILPRSVNNIFSDQNWGWSPHIDDQGRVHHGDSGVRGNPYRINTEIVPGKSWGDATMQHKAWTKATCPYPVIPAGRETGYLQFLILPKEYDVIPHPPLRQ